MDALKKHIIDHQDEFAEALPKNHVKNFKKKRLRRKHFLIRHSQTLGIAATIALLVSIGSVYMYQHSSSLKSMLDNPVNNTQLPEELAMAVKFYSTASLASLDQIRSLNLENDQISEIEKYASEALQEYEENKKVLQQKLNLYPGDDQIKRALIVNEMKKKAFLEKIYNTLKTKTFEAS